MTDASRPPSTAPEKADSVGGYSPQDSARPNPPPGGGAVIAGVAALASLALLFLLPRVGPRIKTWRRSIAGLRLLAPPRER